MENLNAEQIKKALECCHKESIVLCRECPYTKEYNEFCANKLMKDALAIITSQEQRIKELTQAHEMLSESYDHLEKTKDELSAERSRLTEENERLHASCTKLTQNLHECKADTVRKMQRLIEDRLDISADGYSTEEVKNDVFNTIDQIAKEMVEGNDDNT